MKQNIDYAKTPFLVIWETTQACDLACVHCRASAQPHRLPGELSFNEGKKLLSEIKSMGCPIVVLSGGDPLKRSDLEELVSFGKSLKLRMATIPAATSLLTQERITGLKKAGLDQVAFSLDFPTEKLHDSFRQTPGAFKKTMTAIDWAHSVNLPVQINTTITASTLPYLKEMGELVTSLNVVFWEVFFLVPVGRGEDLSYLTAKQCEEAFAILYQIHKESPFIIKVTEAPHYRRYVAQQEGSETQLPKRLRQSEGPGGTMGRAPQAVNAGRGFVFVSYKGEVFPSGFLPISVGSVRTESLVDLYRNTPLFLDLRDTSKLKGVCGRCEYREICGGSRSRAYALTGDCLATDPWCLYGEEMVEL